MNSSPDKLHTVLEVRGPEGDIVVKYSKVIKIYSLFVNGDWHGSSSDVTIVESWVLPYIGHSATVKLPVDADIK